MHFGGAAKSCTTHTKLHEEVAKPSGNSSVRMADHMTNDAARIKRDKFQSTTILVDTNIFLKTDSSAITFHAKVAKKILSLSPRLGNGQSVSQEH